jgi:hypothetical protein
MNAMNASFGEGVFGERGGVRGATQRGRDAGLLLSGILALACGGESDKGLYQGQLKPLFEARCVPCHHSGNVLSLVDIQDPFTPEDGLVGATNEWFKGHPTAPMYTVAPFQPEPENSVLMSKIADRALLPDGCDSSAGPCLRDVIGGFMPPQTGLNAEQTQSIRDWIAAGAQDVTARGPTYPSGTYSCPDFDTSRNRPSAYNRCISQILYNSCSYCHYENGPYSPDLTLAFIGDALIGQPAMFRNDIDLIVPGDPNASFLYMKVVGRHLGDCEEAVDGTPSPSSNIGAPMPRIYEPLSEEQVALVQQWIAEGAKNE